MPDSDVRDARIKAVFQRYDASGDGNLDIDELEKVLKTLGSFTHFEVARVCEDLDKSKDGQVSYEEFAVWAQSKTGPKEAVKAKAILLPNDNDGSEAVFYNFCGAGHCDMDSKSFTKLCKDCQLIDNKLTEKNADILFSNNRVKAKNERRIDFKQFQIALDLVAETKSVEKDVVLAAVLEATRPVLQGTQAEFVRFHDDKSTWTGVHKHAHGTNSSLQPENEAAQRKKRPQEPPVRADYTSRKHVILPQDLKPLDFSVDNRRLWKTFGISLSAGRTLKSLYSDKLSGEKPRERRKTPWPPGQQDTYIAVDSLQTGSPGLHYRRSMHFSDVCPDFIPWGHLVQGDRVDACWLRVGNLFLPTEVHNLRLLKLHEGPKDPARTHVPALGRSCSLPAIRGSDKQGLGDSILRGTSYGN